MSWSLQSCIFSYNNSAKSKSCGYVSSEVKSLSTLSKGWKYNDQIWQYNSYTFVFTYIVFVLVRLSDWSLKFKNFDLIELNWIEKLIMITLFFFSCCPCAAAPYICSDSCRCLKNPSHFCSNCKSYIGTYNNNPLAL